MVQNGHTPALDTEPSALQGFSTEGSNHFG